MMYKFVTVSLLTICAAENVVMLPIRANEEIFSPHVHRHELPYMYGVPHYVARSTVVNPRTEKFPVTYYEKIQYAPLHEQIEQKVKNTATEYTKAPFTTSGITVTPAEFVFHTKHKKDHLEPRVKNISQEPVMKCFSPRHSVDASVSRSPGHNAVYRSLSEALRRNDRLPNLSRQNLRGVSHFVGPYALYEDLNIMTSTMPPFQLPREDSRPFAFNRHFVLNPNLIESPGKQMEKNKRHYSPYAKLHRLHLNIARVYSPGQVPIQAPPFADTSYSLGIKKHESYLPPLYKARADHKTVLYPKDSPKSYRFVLP